MNKLIVLVGFVLAMALGQNVFAQTGLMPPGASDKNLDDRNIKGRSLELERIRREANKPIRKGSEKKSANGEQPALNFAEIKEDFEKMQILQDAITKGYTSGENIDFAVISKSSSEMSHSATRLKANLFHPKSKKDSKESKKDPKESEKEKEATATKDIKSLIIDLDNAIGRFVTSPIFQNLQVIDPKESSKAEVDLDTIIKISATLSQEANKMKTTQN